MVGRIERKNPVVNEDCTSTKKEKSARSQHYGMSKILTTAVGFLAASQNIGLAAAARPLGEQSALAAPTNQPKLAGTLATRPSCGATGCPTAISSDNFYDAFPHPEGEPRAPHWMNDAVLNIPQVRPDSPAVPVSPFVSLSSEESQELSSQGRGLLGTDFTWVVNDSDTEIVATTEYHCFESPAARSHFTNRHIAPGEKDDDKYIQSTDWGSSCESSGSQASVELILGIATAHNVGTFSLMPDDSVVVQNAPGGVGLNVFKTVYGTLHQPNGAPLGQIFNN